MPANEPDLQTIDINKLRLLHRARQLNLEPGFQRRSVWGLRDRQRLIQSIVSGYPLPSIFLYRRQNKVGKPVYDVIDGKQRLETIFMFMGEGAFKDDSFSVRMDLDEYSPACQYGSDWWWWEEICSECPEVRNRFYSYKMQTVEVDYPLGQIVDLFVRINSTGKPLTGMEKRHARFYESPFLKAAERLVRELGAALRQQKVLSQAQIDRMKGTELLAELLMSVQRGGIINKKTALDRALGNDSVQADVLSRLSAETKATVKQMLKTFPHLKETRFRNTVDFYSLFLIVWEMRHEGFALGDQGRQAAAEAMLRRLSTGVDELRERKRLKPLQKPPSGPDQRLFADYLLTVQGDTDSSVTRERRARILRGLLHSLFERKDAKRTFTPEQRRILWNSDGTRKCSDCGKPITWDTFTVDHVKAWVKGGPTYLENAQLLCRPCNSKKGAS